PDPLLSELPPGQRRFSRPPLFELLLFLSRFVAPLPAPQLCAPRLRGHSPLAAPPRVAARPTRRPGRRGRAGADRAAGAAAGRRWPCSTEWKSSARPASPALRSRRHLSPATISRTSVRSIPLRPAVESARAPADLCRVSNMTSPGKPRPPRIGEAALAATMYSIYHA